MRHLFVAFLLLFLAALVMAAIFGASVSLIAAMQEFSDLIQGYTSYWDELGRYTLIFLGFAAAASLLIIIAVKMYIKLVDE